MNILNINEIYQPNLKQHSANSINFRQKSYVTKIMLLQGEKFNQVNSIKDLYTGILDEFYHLSGKRQGLFRRNNTNILNDRNVGFVFRDITNKTSKLLQVAEFWNKDQKHFSFRILDKDKNLILRYIFRPDGNVEISADKKDVKNLKVDVFQGSEKILEIDILNNIINEFKKLKSNIDLLYENRCKPTTSFIESKVEKKSLDFLYTEQINALLDNYKELLELFSKHHKYEHTIIKKEFWGKDYLNLYSSGMIMPKEGSEDELYYFCPFKQKKDDRLFKISLMDKDQKLLDTLIFFQDGKVMSMKYKTSKSEHFPKENLLPVYQEDAIKFDLDNIFRQINSKIDDFKQFIQERDNAKKAKKEARKVQNKLKRDEKLQAERIKKQEDKAKLKEEKKVRQSTKKKVQTENLKVESPSLRIARDEQLTISKENGVPSLYRTIANSENWNKNFYHFDLSELVENLNTIFSMPAENHSHHLIHEKLSNGKILNNRLSMFADDGTKVVVTRVLLHDNSNKINAKADYAYKIEIESGNKTLTCQVKASNAHILKTNAEGTLIRGSLSGISSMSKADYISKNAEADLIPKYMREFFKYTEGDGINVINTKLKLKQPSVTSEIDKFIEELRDKTEY